jgi:hypothetical protein
MGFSALVSLSRRCHPSYGVLTVTPAGLPPAECASLGWTHDKAVPDIAFTLPFFSRVTLRQAWRRLTGLGYRVYLAKVQVAEERAKLKRYKN